MPSDRPMRFARLLLATSVALVAACDAGPAGKVTAEDCVKLRDHRARLVVERSASHLDEAQKVEHRKNISAAAGDEIVKQCVEGTTMRVLECQLAARSLEAFETCARTGGD
jgi:hypothetical protein